MLKKNVALEIPYTSIRRVEIKEDMFNWRIELDTDDGLIALSAQQKELSEFRTSGTLSVGMSGFGSGIGGSRPAEDCKLAPCKSGCDPDCAEGSARQKGADCVNLQSF